MSWDVMVMRFPEDFEGDFDDLPDEWEPEELFTHCFFAEEIKGLFPKIEYEDENWMRLDEKTFSIEFNIGEDDPITSIMLHVRGENEALKAIESLCKKFDLQALDTTDSKLIDFSKEENDGFSQWRKYKNDVTGNE